MERISRQIYLLSSFLSPTSYATAKHSELVYNWYINSVWLMYNLVYNMGEFIGMGELRWTRNPNTLLDYYYARTTLFKLLRFKRFDLSSICTLHNWVMTSLYLGWLEWLESLGKLEVNTWWMAYWLEEPWVRKALLYRNLGGNHSKDMLNSTGDVGYHSQF